MRFYPVAFLTGILLTVISLGKSLNGLWRELATLSHGTALVRLWAGQSRWLPRLSQLEITLVNISPMATHHAGHTPILKHGVWTTQAEHS